MHRTRTWNMDQPVLRGRNRVLPIEGGDGSTLSLDFTAMSSLDSRFTFTRASTGTYINSAGLVTTMAAASTNDPTKARFDYDPITLAPRGLLIEGSAPNLTLYSEALNQVSATQWVGANFNTPTVPAGAPNSPYGTTTASWKLVATSGAGIHMWRNYVTFTAAAYTFSFWAKAAEYDRIVLADPGTGRGGCTFVLSGNGTATVITGTTTPTNPTIVPYPNGWYRCSVTMTMTAAAYALGIAGYPSTGATVSAYGASYTADGASGVYATMFQTELASGASSYVASGASQGQRAADVCTMSGTNFSSWFNSTEGTFLGTGERAITSNFGRLLSANANNTTSAFDLGASTTGRWVITNSTSQADITAGTVSANTVFKVAGSFASNDAQMAFNGTLGTVDTSVSLPTVSQLDIGADRTAVYLSGRIRSIKFWPTRLPDATLQSLTQ